jgi:cytoskeletal protein CcmA (bactofilin family)
MFSRRPDRPKEEPRFAPSSPTARPNELVAVPVAATQPGLVPPPGTAPVGGPQPMPGSGVAPMGIPEPTPFSGMGDETVIAPRDQVTGKLVSRQGVRVLGTFDGTIESDTYIRMGDASRVKADVRAEEVIVAGQYEGKLVARGRLEIAATGQIKGDIEAPRLLLHEGGLIDGALHMTPAEDRPAGSRASSGSSSSASAGSSSSSSSEGRTAADASGAANLGLDGASGSGSGSVRESASTSTSGSSVRDSSATQPAMARRGTGNGSSDSGKRG